MLIINSKEQKKLLNMNKVIETVATSLVEYSAGRTNTPVRTVLPVEKSEGSALFMPSLAESVDGLGIKCVNVYPNNKLEGKPAIQGVVLLSDIKTGEPLALLEGSYLTMIRTGALSGVATKYLANEDAKTLCIIGTGAQAEGLVRAVVAVRSIEKVRLYNRTSEKAKAFKQVLVNEELFNSGDIEVLENADDAIRHADIIVTATNSDVPVFSSECIQPGVHINAVGSFKPTMQEIPSEVMTAADKIVVEAKEAALEEAGDLIIPINEGNLTEENIYAELGEIVNGEHTVRETQNDITVFESVGLGVADILIAKLFYEEALKHGLGTDIALN